MTGFKVAEPRVTRAQAAVLTLVAEGRTDQEIARLLGVTLRTAQGHVRTLRWRLAANNRAHAVAIGYQLGLLPTDRRVGV